VLCSGRPRCSPRLLVVTSAYHLRRALQLFACAGADARGAATELPPTLGAQAGWTVYEYAAGIASLLSHACARARR